jgi:hypothetical protein
MSQIPTVAAQASGPVRVALIVLIAGTLLAPLAARLRRQSFDPFEPIVLFAAVYGAMFVVRPAAMLIRGEPVYEGPRTTLDVSGTYDEMLVLALLGALGFVCGYVSSAGAVLARLAPIHAPRDLRRAGVIACLVGAAGVIAFGLSLTAERGPDGLYLFVRGRSNDLREALAAPSLYPWAASLMIVPATIAVAGVAWARNSWRFALLAFVLAAVVLLRAVPTGNRLLLLPFLGGLFVLYFLQRGTRPRALMLIALAAAALIGSAVLSDLRGRGDRNESALASIQNTVTDPARVITPFTTGPDTEMAATLAAALEIIPSEEPHTFGATTFGDLVTRPVPRPLWEGKPRSPREELIATLWPVESRRGLNPEFSALLFFYWDFSYPGVVVGLALYGILTRALFQLYLRQPTLLPAQALFALGLWFLPLVLRNSPVDSAINLLFGLAPLPIIFWLAARRERSASARA